MVLIPVRMKKIGLLGLRDDEERILTLLYDLRVAQVEPLAPEEMAELAPERGTETLRAVGDEALRFRGLLNALPAVGPPAPRRFGNVTEILAIAQTVPIDSEVAELKREDDRLVTEEKGLRDTLALLDRLSFYTDRLEYLRSESFHSFYGEATPEALAALLGTLPREADARLLPGPVDEATRRFVLVLRPSGADALSRTAQSQGLRLQSLPPLDGPPAEERDRLGRELSIVAERRAWIASRLREVAAEWYPTIASIAEALEVENRKTEVLAKIGAGRATFALEAWVPQRDIERLRTIVQHATGNRVYFFEVPTKEEPPTMMGNPRGVRRFEFFIRFYSLPQADEWDPTLIFAIVFPLFFGLMLGDWGYGLTILLISLWMIRGFPGAQHLPRAGRRFVKLIMGPKGMQQLAWALLPGCALAIALGLVFDEFFGFHLFQYFLGWTPLVDPLKQVGPFLLIAGYIGLGMVTVGFLLGALKENFHHRPRHALGKVGGIAFAWGIAGYGLDVIHSHAIVPPLSTVFVLSLVGLALGVALIFASEGVFGALGLIDIISHILSYTRLVGILLASVVLAVVINTIAVLAFHSMGAILGPVAGAAVGVLLAAIVLVGGQAFNVILGVFEPGIQGARLIFVEHFSKYYTGNGRPFRPFGAPRTHTLSSITEDGTGLAAGPIVRGPSP
jgi:V/A-type H+/Na+-transporting ATPase subunit I